MNGKLLDTNIIIRFINGDDSLNNIFEEDNLFFSSITLGELFYGAECSNRKEENAKVASAATTLKEKETERKNKEAERARLSGEVTQFEKAIVELKKAANAPSTQQSENEDQKKKKQS